MFKVRYQIQHQSNVRVRIDKHWETRTVTQPIKQCRRKRVSEQKLRIHDKYGETRMYIYIYIYIYRRHDAGGMLIRIVNKFSLSLSPSCIWQHWRTPNLRVRKYLWVRLMCSKQVRGDSYWALGHQTPQNGTMTTSGLLKWSEQVYTRFLCAGWTSKMCTDNFVFLYSVFCLVAGFVYSR